MCGIFGGYWQSGTEVPSGRLRDAQRLLHHRGPDDRGLETFDIAGGRLVLGHTRLSIIDLSPGGHQPMYSTDGRYTIVFNGEIYNYRELRQELRSLGYAFITDSDTEVLLACWMQWGTDCLQRLIGMFAFALFDHQAKALTLVRDAFGIKPLFFCNTSDGIIFASEMAALLSLCTEAPKLNLQRTYDYLINQVQDSGFDTFTQGVSHLPPAHWLRFDLRQLTNTKSERWWNPSIAETSCLSFTQAAEQLRELFLDNVRLHLRSDVPLGVALSGGIDSSAIACCIRHIEPQMELHTFSYIGEHGSQSEEPWIDLINSRINAICHKVYVEPKDLYHDLSDLIRTQGEPFGGTAMYAQMRVFKCAYEAGIKVLLEGQGGDEILGGYYGYPGQIMLSYLEKNNIAKMFRFARKFNNWEGRGIVNPWRALVGQILPNNIYNLCNTLLGREPVPKWLNARVLRKNGVKMEPFRPIKYSTGRGRRLMETLLQSLTVHGVTHLLRYGDRNAMRYSVENRVPFLTIPIAEFMLSLPEHYLISETGETKSVFRAAMRGIVPDEILNRRDKVGFDTPMREWMRHRIRTDFSAFNQKRLSGIDYIFMPEIIEEVTRAFNSDKPFDWQIWRIYNLLAWYDQIPLLDTNNVN